MTVETIIAEIRALPDEERARLINAILAEMVGAPVEQPVHKTRSILEFEGVGAEIWRGIDAQEYVNRLRQDWDERP
jgi:hypothetical protein